MNDPLKVQVAGDHYKKWLIQPIEFAMANNWDACAFSAFKYIVRHRDKAGRVDLDKAKHFVDLRCALVRGIHARGIPVITIDEFIEKNEIADPSTRSALRALDWWVYNYRPHDRVNREMGDGVKEAIDSMIADHYPAF